MDLHLDTLFLYSSASPRKPASSLGRLDIEWVIDLGYCSPGDHAMFNKVWDCAGTGEEGGSD